MLEYYRIAESGGSNVNKNNSSPECIILHYGYFLKIYFRFQPNVYDVRHDLTERTLSFNDVSIV